MKKTLRIVIDSKAINPIILQSMIEELQEYGVFDEKTKTIQYDDSDKALENVICAILDKYCLR